MEFTRRQSMVLGLAGMAVTVLPFAARAQEATQQANPPAAPAEGLKPGGDTYMTDNGEIGIIPIAHASFVMTVPGMVIYADPVGGADAFSAYPAADLILVTHEHQDHFSPETLSALVGEAALAERYRDGLAAFDVSVQSRGNTAAAGLHRLLTLAGIR